MSPAVYTFDQLKATFGVPSETAVLTPSAVSLDAAAFSVTTTAIGVALPGVRPVLAANRNTLLLAAAQANLPSQSWSDALSADRRSQLCLAIANYPGMHALADADRAGWLGGLWGFAALGGAGAREAARAWSKTSARYRSDADFDRDWASFKPKPDGVTAGTVLAAAEKAGFDLEPWRELARPTKNSTTVVSAQLATELVDLSNGSATPLSAIPKNRSKKKGFTSSGLFGSSGAA
jgi:hypothetical protein